MPDSLGWWDFTVLFSGMLGGVFIGLFISARWCRRTYPDKIIQIHVGESRPARALVEQVKKAFDRMGEE